ncbi:MAG: response regulator/pilus assembly protein [Chloroflexi bacterium]|nr:response regulator/pilus assembly protein [Chloroflexota bacterium]
MLNQPRALIVDDQAGILKLVGHMFKDEGFEVHVADNGEKGFAKARKIKPDIVILDVMMPGMSGLDVCKQLRAHPVTARIPIIMLSARSQVPEKVEGFEAGADDYVSKPVARAELMARVRALLARASYGQQSVAQVVAFVGAKGGVGTTTLAINTAVSLINQGHTVTIVELRNSQGTAVHQLRMTPEQDLGKLIKEDADSLSSRHIRRAVLQHKTGINLLAAPQKPTNHKLTGDHTTNIIQALSGQTDYLLLDMPHAFGEVAQEALENADQVILVTESEQLSVTAASYTLETLKSYSMLDRTHVVAISRSPSAMMLRQEEIEQNLKIKPGKVIAIVPPSPDAFQQSSRVGKPVISLKPDILSAQAMQKVAKWIVEYNLSTTPAAA